MAIPETKDSKDDRYDHAQARIERGKDHTVTANVELQQDQSCHQQHAHGAAAEKTG